MKRICLFIAVTLICFGCAGGDKTEPSAKTSIKTIPQTESSPADGLRSASKDSRTLIRYIGAHPDQVDARDGSGRGLFHWLAERDDVALVKGLIGIGFSRLATAVDQNGRIPLHEARSAAMAQVLMEWPVHVRGKLLPKARSEKLVAPELFADKAGELPIHVMIENNSPAVEVVAARMCAESTVWTYPINTEDTSGRRPLHLAKVNGNSAAVDAISKCPDARY